MTELGIKDELVKYSNEILNGDIVACIKHKQACQRFLNDLDKQSEETFPYVFDETKAGRFIDWMKLFKHRKGVLAGRYIDPHIIQKFIFANIYGWVKKENGLRRFNKAYWQVARKNAKSQSLGTVGSYEASAFGEPSAEVYCAATKKSQSKIVWDEIDEMIRANENLKDKFKVAYGTITHLKSGSTIKPLSKEDRKTGDGTSPSAFIVDEYHLHETAEMYDIGDTGMGARLQPLMMIITTSGFNLTNPCYRVEYKYVSQILDPNNPIENEQYFVMVNELDKDDDIKDENVWPKSNPIISSYDGGMNYLRSQLKIALDVPEKMKTFLTKNMNIWVDQKDNGYMMMDRWSKCGQEVDLSILENLECTAGVDLSAKIDLTSLSFEFELPDDKYLVLSHSFMPEDTLEVKSKTDKVPYSLWEEQGWITTTPGAVVDYNFIKSYIKNFEEKYKCRVKEICSDPWNASQFMQDMEQEGYVVIEIRQGMATLGGPTKDFREQVYRKKLIHNNNPVLTWSINNAVTKQDSNENIMLDKSKATDRIDPIASLINAHVRAMLFDNEIDLNAYIMSEDFSL